MKVDEIREIMDCLPKGRTKFYYFKNRYQDEALIEEIQMEADHRFKTTAVPVYETAGSFLF